MSYKHKLTTYTFLILEYLKKVDDFRTYADLMTAVNDARPDVVINDISAACFHLKKHKAIDSVVDHRGTVFWFATPETDDRSRTIDERTPESKPRNRRRRVTIIIDGDES